MKEIGSCFNCGTMIFDGHILQSDDMMCQCPICGDITDVEDLRESDVTYWFVLVEDADGDQDEMYLRIHDDDGEPEEVIVEMSVAQNFTIIETRQMDNEEYYECVDTELVLFGEDNDCDCDSDDDDEEY